MAKYTVTPNTPEIVYDDMCTQATIKKPERVGEEPGIEVKTVFDTTEGAGAIQGCKNETFTGLTLCLRPVKNFDYANNHDYRQNQEETKTLIKQGEAITRLQEIKTELTTNNFQASTEKTKIPAKL